MRSSGLLRQDCITEQARIPGPIWPTVGSGWNPKWLCIVDKGTTTSKAPSASDSGELAKLSSVGRLTVCTESIYHSILLSLFTAQIVPFWRPLTEVKRPLFLCCIHIINLRQRTVTVAGNKSKNLGLRMFCLLCGLSRQFNIWNSTYLWLLFLDIMSLCSPG